MDFLPKEVIQFLVLLQRQTSRAILRYYGSTLFLVCIGAQWFWRWLQRHLAVKSLSYLPYPVTPKESISDTLHGIPVSDPYRWLENIYSYATVTWLQQQQKCTHKYFDQLPADHFKQRYRALLYPKYGASFLRNGEYYYLQETPNKSHYALYKSSFITCS